MKGTKIWAVAICAAALFSFSCGRMALTADEVYGRCASGVVLVINSHYVSLTLPSGARFYWSANYNGFTDNAAIIADYADRELATGYFISADGQIVTSLAVLHPTLDQTALWERFHKFIADAITEIDEGVRDLKQEQQRVVFRIKNAEMWFQPPRASDVTRRHEIERLLSECAAERKMWTSLRQSDMLIEPINDLRIAYNNTSVPDISRLEQCETLSENSAYSTAIIALRRRQTPEKCHIFLTDKSDNVIGDPDPQSNNQTLYTLYFEPVFDSQTTIKARLTTNTPPSPGCPVVNQYGELINAYND